jgi:hypothetical protein
MQSRLGEAKLRNTFEIRKGSDQLDINSQDALPGNSNPNQCSRMRNVEAKRRIVPSVGFPANP